MILSDDIAWSAAFAAGLLSFFSPCILPLVPSYFSFITGVSIDRLTDEATGALRRGIILSTLGFVLGFSMVFILLGATAAFFSALIHEAREYLRIGGGVLIMVFGVHLLGLWRIRFLEMDRRIQMHQRPVHILAAFMIGTAFAAGWSPCIGPLLGAVLILAANQDTVAQGVGLLAVYSAGVALPFIGLSLGIHYLIGFIRRATKTIRYVNMAAGVLLIATGALLVTDRLRMLGF